MEIKVMVVPGKIARVEIPAGATVLAVCEQAEHQMPGVGWVTLATGREVRVQNRTFSNIEKVGEYAGSIHTTPLNDGEVILILTKIKGNAPGEAVLTCSVDGVEFALETPDKIGNVLVNVAGYDLSKVKAVRVDGELSPLDQLVGGGDEIEVEFHSAPEPETVTVVINGHTVTGKPEDIGRILTS